MSGENDIFRFLWRVARTRLREADALAIQEFLRYEGVPWGRVVGLAEEQGVAGLLFHHLQSLGLAGGVPPEPRRQLEKLYLETATKTLALCAQAAAAATLLREAGVPVLALQGLAVVGLYGDPGLRPLGDADLLIRPQDKDRARELLLRAGYVTYDPLFPDLFSKNGAGLDLHTHILNLDRIASRRYLFPADLTPMWEQAAPGSGGQDALLQLDPRDRLIALAAHAMKHGYSRLIWLADLHESLLALPQSAEDWQALAGRSRLWKQGRVTGYALHLVQRIFGLEVPPGFREELGIRGWSRLEERLLESVLRGSCSREFRLLLALHNIPGFGDKCRFLRESAFPDPEVMQQLFPQASGRRKTFIFKRIVDTCRSIWNRH